MDNMKNEHNAFIFDPIDDYLLIRREATQAWPEIISCATQIWMLR